jgi:membrane carboxypeptidase/penicillin-binding protein
VALQRGATPASIVSDVPTDFTTSTGSLSPFNCDRHCYGPVRDPRTGATQQTWIEVKER